MSQHLRRERDDPHEALVAELPADGAEDARPARVAAVADDHRGVLVEADVGAVGTTALLHGAHDDGLDHVTALHTGAGQRVLHRGDDDVTDARVASPRAAEHPDAENLLRTGVVGDTQSRLLLDHVQLPNTCGDSRAGSVNRLSDSPRADAPTAWRRRCVRSTGDRDAARTRASRPGYSYPSRPRRAAPYLAFSTTEDRKS